MQTEGSAEELDKAADVVQSAAITSHELAPQHQLTLARRPGEPYPVDLYPGLAPPTSPRVVITHAASPDAADPGDVASTASLQQEPQQEPQQEQQTNLTAQFYSVRTIGSETLHDCNGLPFSAAAYHPDEPPTRRMYQMRTRFAPTVDRARAPHLEHLFQQRWYDQRAPPQLIAFAGRSIGQRNRDRPTRGLAPHGRNNSSKRILPTRAAFTSAEHRAAPALGINLQPTASQIELQPPLGSILEAPSPPVVAALVPPAYRFPPALASNESLARLTRPSSAPTIRQPLRPTARTYGASSSKVARPASAQVLTQHSTPLVRTASTPGTLSPSSSLPPSMTMPPGETAEPYLAHLRQKRL